MGTVELRSAEAVAWTRRERGVRRHGDELFPGDLRIERGGFRARARRIGKDVEIVERSESMKRESGCMVGSVSPGKSGDDVGAYGGMGRNRE